MQVQFHAPAHSWYPWGALCWCWNLCPLPDRQLQGHGGANALVFLSRLGSERFICAHIGGGVGWGRVSMFEDLVFTITEKTAPNIFS